MRSLFNQILTCCFCLALLVTSCTKSNEFTIEGVVTGADGQTLVLNHVGLTAVNKIDSVKLNSNGKFSFKKARTEYPEFYQLQLKGNLINLAVDSTEVISVHADAGTFATSYSVDGSENSKAIKTIALAHLDANQIIHKLRQQLSEKQISESEFENQMLEAIENYKEVARKYIYSAPMSTAAYFALFQKSDGLLFFDLYDRTDSKSFAAVATSFDHFYPESERSKRLHDLALQSIKVTRVKRDVDMRNIATKEVSLLEIKLPNVKGDTISLSDVSTNKLTLLNFTIFQAGWSDELNTLLSELFAKYHNRGLEVYQISLDSDVHLWKNKAYNFPWYSVYDEQSVYSQVAALYNVKHLPTIYIIDKKGNITKKVESLDLLESDVQKYL